VGKCGKRGTVPVGLEKITPKSAKSQEKTAKLVNVPVELEITIRRLLYDTRIVQ
jgi:hypothetical protein